MKKLAFALLLVACQTQHNPEGYTDKLTSVKMPAHHKPQTQIEWVCYDGEVSTYLQTLIGHFSLHTNNEAKIVLQTKEKTISFLAPILEGGQKIKIPSNWVPILLQMSHEGIHMNISVGQHSIEIKPEDVKFFLLQIKKKNLGVDLSQLSFFDL